VYLSHNPLLLNKTISKEMSSEIYTTPSLI